MIEILKVDGSRIPRNTMTFSEARDIVGYIERLDVGEGILLIDEDGHMKGLAPNYNASLIAGQTIVGDAIYLTGDDVERVLG